LIVRAGERPAAETVTGIGSAAELIERILGHAAHRPAPPPFIHAAAGERKLLRRAGKANPASLAAYRDYGGYRALPRAIELGPAAVIQAVVASNLLGRGGAAFPTGKKWEAVAREPARPHFLVCNADESEPGTFKDRVLLEEDPFAIVEAMTIAAHATACEQGFIYIRGEYPLAATRVQAAIDAAREARLLGRNVMGKGFALDLEIRRGAGAYICGEETALFNSLEGKRGEPRSKPPFPAQVGLFGKPTVVNNVETLVNVLDIVLEGGEAWASVGTQASTGTRLFCLSGHVEHPGLYEVPFGLTLAELLDMAGGVAAGRPLQAILLGGAAGTFVGREALAMRLTFEDVRAAGATLGSGVVMVFDDTADLGDTLRRIAQFMADESCGQCVPCRVGTVRQVELLQRLASDPALRGSEDERLVLLTELGQAMRDASICGLGQTASSAIESAVSRLHVFRNGSRTRRAGLS
jgi:NADH-quinone oxidoreductase subunit F